jgi:TolB-like protein
MASLIPGYQYDIFVSYRQKDNKGDRWVSEFVSALRTELEATFKEDISIYFDENPHDRLQDTYNVDKSLEGKLKCLIFIPILSQTFCDPNSYAWQREFLAFNRLAENDRLGRDIKLRSGNVASRILPIRIHDLDPDDIKLFEKETGTVLRALDFVFKTSSGVNRPLSANEDHPNENLNKTFYRDQINKVANAIKEIISGLKSSGNVNVEVIPEKNPSDNTILPKIKSYTQTYRKRTIIISSVIVLCIALFSVFLFWTNNNDSVTNNKKSVAVLPFSDFSPNHDQEYFSNGMMEEILNQLAKIHDLDVISRTSSMVYKDSKLPLKRIAHELNVSNVVEGSVQKADNRIRITVQLIDGNSEKHIWSESFDRDLTDIFAVQTEISLNIVRELKSILTIQEEKLIRQIPTKNLLAYDSYLIGIQAASQLQWGKAISMFSKAIEADPEFTLAYVKRASYYSMIYFTKGDYFQGDWRSFDRLAKTDLEKALKLDPELPEVKFAKAELLYRFERKHDEALEILNDLEAVMPNNHSFYCLRSFVLRRKGKWEESLQDGKRSIILDPFNLDYYNQIGHTYRLMRKYSDAVYQYNKFDNVDSQAMIQYDLFLVTLEWKGDLSEAKVNSGLSFSQLGQHSYLTYNYYYYSREFDKLIPIIISYEDQFNYIPKVLNLAQIYFHLSNFTLSRVYADSAITELKMKIKDFPDDERYYASLGYAYAYMGDYKKAIENALKAVNLKPIILDSWQGYIKEEDLARIYILSGEFDLAMDKIEYLLTIPGDLSVPLLKIDPAFDKLRDLPRFKKILSTEYKTIY